MIPIYQPYIQPYTESAKDALNSGWISNYGKYIDLSTEMLKKLSKVNYTILMSNGTVATECLLMALKFKYPEVKDIYVPNHCFVSPYNVCLRHFPKESIHILNINENTCNLDTSCLAQIKQGSCVLIVHTAGSIVNVPELARLRPDLIFIEDNCEGFLGEYEGIPTGSCNQTLCSAISFYANKNLTTGEGGAFFTNDLEVYQYIKKAYSHGMTQKRYVHDLCAWNFRMTNVQAALLYDQLLDVDHIFDLKCQVRERYRMLLKDELQVQLIDDTINTVSSMWMNVCKVHTEKSYEQIEDEMKAKGVEIRPFFYDVREHTHLNGVNLEECTFCASCISSNTLLLMIPSSPTLTLEEQTRVIESLKASI